MAGTVVGFVLILMLVVLVLVLVVVLVIMLECQLVGVEALYGWCRRGFR